jgi:hypothetical protein
VAEPWTKEGTAWDKAAHERLMSHWVKVFGTVDADGKAIEP